MPEISDGVASAAEVLITQLVAVLALTAWAWSRWQRPAAGRDHHTWAPQPRQRIPTDAEIEARVSQLAALGALPAGWSRRDAERLLRIRGRLARRSKMV